MRTVSCAIAIALSFGFSPRASAQSPDAPTLSYHAPAACPTADGFLQRLRSRLGESHGAASPARTLDVEIAASSGRFVAKLSLVEADGRSTTKTLEDADCGELVDALALVAALALETDDVDGSDRNRSTPPAPATSASTTAPGSASASTSRSGSGDAPSSAPAPSAPVSIAPPAPALASASESSPSSRIGLALGGLATVGPAPRALLGAALVLHWVQLGTGPFTPAVDLGGTASLSPDAPEAKGTASFAWLTARAIVYLVQWPLGAGVVLRGGVEGDFGVLLARGQDTTSPSSSSRPWASLGAVASVEVPLGSRFAVQPGVALEAPLRRDRYAFGSTDFFQVPFVIATGSISVVAYVR